MTEKLHSAIESCEVDAAAGGRALRSLLTEDPKGFLLTAISMMRGVPGVPVPENLLKLLGASDRVVEHLCDPKLLSDQEAIELAKLLAGAEPHLDTKLVRLLPLMHGTLGRPANPVAMERVLMLLDAIPPSQRIVPALASLLRDPNPRLRAKAALLMGRRVQNTQFAAERLQEADARVRANAIESLWGDKTASAISLFWCAVKDTNNRVVGNALVGLYQSQDRNAISCILKMAADASPQFRMTAAWAMGEAADPRFLPTLEKLTRDLYALVRKNASKAIGRVREAMTAESNLQLRVLRADKAHEGDRTVWIQALDPDGAPVRGLLSSNFILWDNQKLVTEYELIEHDASERLGVGFLLCRDGAEQAMADCLEQKPAEHLWAIAKSISGAENPPAIYAPDPKKLEASLAETPVNAALIPGLVKIEGSRNLVLFIGSDAPADEACVAAAVEGHVAIHAVVVGTPHESVKSACQQTGGILMVLAELAGIGSAFRNLYSALSNRYSIRYRPDPAGANGRIEVYSQNGRGECPV